MKTKLMLKHRFSTFSQYPLGIGFLTLFRKVIFLCYHPKHLLFPRIYGDDEVSAVVSNAIESKQPCMISRFGAVEISAVYNYVGVTSHKHNYTQYLLGKAPEWWWNEGVRRCMTDNAGFFPATNGNLLRFGELMMEAMKSIDVLISWQDLETQFAPQLNCKQYINYIQIEPFWAKEPWTYHLKGKKVLVVHPFAQEIQYQYTHNRERLFENPKVLPEFTLITYKAVQSIGGNCEFTDWFEALEHMKQEIAKLDFDICLLGCGAYGMPLAAFIKETLGKTAIHVGGSLQLFFGVWGSRWDNPDYGTYIHHDYGRYPRLRNEYWIRPYAVSQVEGSEKVDNNCYW